MGRFLLSTVLALGIGGLALLGEGPAAPPKPSLEKPPPMCLRFVLIPNVVILVVTSLLGH